MLLPMSSDRSAVIIAVPPIDTANPAVSWTLWLYDLRCGLYAVFQRLMFCFRGIALPFPTALAILTKCFHLGCCCFCCCWHDAGYDDDDD